MNDNEKKFDDKIGLKVSGQLSDDLKAFFKPDVPVPAEVDRAIMEQAHRRLLGRRPVRLLRWAGCVAAAAAVIIFVFMLATPKEAELTDSRSVEKSGPMAFRSAPGPVWADVDQNGHVDILDAFKLARQIESTARPDVKWDINGDGVVNRADVDSIALAAVRLDKGVL